MKAVFEGKVTYEVAFSSGGAEDCNPILNEDLG